MLDAVETLWGYRGLIGNLAQRELKAKYKKSVLGWVWSLINPAATLLIYAVVFGLFLRIQPPIGGNGHLKNFAMYLFAALILWNYFNGVIAGGMASLLGAGPLIKKVYFPAECIIVANTVATLLQACVESLVLAAIMIVVGNASLTFLLFPFVLMLFVMFCLGVALVASLVNAYFRDVNYIVSIGMNLFFYATPIVYPLRIIPKQIHGIPAQTIISLNPLAKFVQASRDIFYGLRIPTFGTWAYLFIWAVVMLGFGWTVFIRFARDVAEEL